MAIRIVAVKGLLRNQAWWLLCTVLPSADAASRVLDDAESSKVDWGDTHHVFFHEDTSYYDVMIRLEDS